MGKFIRAFAIGGCIATLGLLAIAVVAAGGPPNMGVYDLMALPVIFLAGGVVGLAVQALRHPGALKTIKEARFSLLALFILATLIAVLLGIVAISN